MKCSECNREIGYHRPVMRDGVWVPAKVRCPHAKRPAEALPEGGVFTLRR